MKRARVLSLPLLFVVVACSTASSGPPDQGGGAGSGGGRETAGAGGDDAAGKNAAGGSAAAGASGADGEGGSAGAVAKGGAGGAAGEGNGGGTGDAGAGGTCTLVAKYSSKDAVCNDCAEGQCCAEVNGCLGDPRCNDDYVNCQLACALLPDDEDPAAIEACFAKCDVDYPEGKQLYDMAIGCVEKKCAAVCE